MEMKILRIGWKEDSKKLPINFMPDYKYQLQNNAYDKCIRSK